MNRRNFLLGLLAAPLAALGLRAKPKIPPLSTITTTWSGPSRPTLLDMASGSDQTSIWLINWHPPELPRVFHEPYAKWKHRMWLKGRIS